MEIIEMNVAILDGTSKAQLRKAIRTYEENHKCNVLTFFVTNNHRFFMVEYDGIGVSKWYGDIEEFLADPTDVKMELKQLL